MQLAWRGLARYWVLQSPGSEGGDTRGRRIINIARAIDLLEDIQTGEGTVFEVTPELAEGDRMAIEELAAERWIPVEEQLPGNSEITLVTRKCRNAQLVEESE